MRLAQRLVAGLALVLVLAVAGSGPVGADPARPTDFRSRVTAIEPPVDGIEVDVVGGDAFLELSVDRGHEATVLGYQREPYLRFRADGTVERNRSSPATYINEDRFGAAVPDRLAGDALPSPEWERVADGGRYVWHDHRIHFMGGTLPAGLEAGRAAEWTVDVVIDGRPVAVSGSYRLLGAPSPLPWIAVAAAVAAAAAPVGWGRPVTVAVVASALGSAIALAVGAVDQASVPPGAGASPLTVALPAIAAVAAAVAVIGRSRSTRVVAVLGTAAALVGWVLSRTSVLWKAVLPTDLAPNLDRAGTAVVIGLAVASAVLAVRSGALAPPGQRSGADRPGAPTATTSPPA